MMSIFAKDRDPTKYLKYEEQLNIARTLERLALHQPASKSLIFSYAGVLSLAPCYVFSFMAWRASFRGYNLVRYGRGRVTTAFLAAIYPVYGAVYHYSVSQPLLVEPFRRENPWFYGLVFGAMQQLSSLTILMNNIGVCYIFGSSYGTIPLPGKGQHKPTLREIGSEMVLKRVKPYLKTLAKVSLASSVYMFVVGYCAYNQSCSLLASTMNRRTLGLKENNEELSSSM